MTKKHDKILSQSTDQSKADLKGTKYLAYYVIPAQAGIQDEWNQDG